MRLRRQVGQCKWAWQRRRPSKKGSKAIPVERHLAGAQPQGHQLRGRAHAHRCRGRPRATQPVAELDLVSRAQAAAAWKHCTQSTIYSQRKGHATQTSTQNSCCATRFPAQHGVSGTSP